MAKEEPPKKYKYHRPGSRKSRIRIVFESDGLAAAGKLAKELETKDTTFRAWARDWEKEARGETPTWRLKQQAMKADKITSSDLSNSGSAFEVAGVGQEGEEPVEHKNGANQLTKLSRGKNTKEGSTLTHANPFVSFLRHYGPIPASDNMYDELIQTEIDRYGISPPIAIQPARLSELLENFKSKSPNNVILTGTAGDGKTYHCRRVWEEFGGAATIWQRGEKIARLDLGECDAKLVIIKDLSELTAREKAEVFPKLAAAVRGDKSDEVFLVAANDGQLVASWRDWAEQEGDQALAHFKILEEMLVEERSTDSRLRLRLYNLSRLDPSEHFDALIEQIVEHSQWKGCEGCELYLETGNSTCPIQLNRQHLRAGEGETTFRKRLGELLRLAGANRMHLPIRDLLLLGVNIIMGDQRPGQPLLTCKTAKNRAAKKMYAQTNPFANAFGANLSEKDKQKYQAFTVLDNFGIGRETDNRYDNLLIYGPYNEKERYHELVESDPFYGAPAYQNYLRDYLEGERESVREFMGALERQRRRLFFTLPEGAELDPWRLSVYRSAGALLEFASKLSAGDDVAGYVETLVRGLNRTFCGMMIDDGSQLYLASSGGDGRGRIASVLNYGIRIGVSRRDIYCTFELGENNLTPSFVVIDPTKSNDARRVDCIDLQLTHFEFLMRVAHGSLPSSFSRQCYEDFLDFKLRLIKRLDLELGEVDDPKEVALHAITVDENGRAQIDDIRIRVGAS